MMTETEDDDIPLERANLSSRQTVLFVIVLLGLVLFAVVQYRAVPATSPALGKLAAAMRFRAIDKQGDAVAERPIDEASPKLMAGETGQDFQLSSLHGNVILINFWGPWCFYCKEEMPYLVKLCDRLKKNADFRLLSVTCSGGETVEDAAFVAQSKQYLDSVQARFELCTDPQSASRREIAQLCGSDNFGYPTTMIIDRQGTIRGLWSGYHEGDGPKMTALLEKLLASP